MQLLIPGLGHKKNLKSDVYSLELSNSSHPYLIVRSKRAKHIRIKLSHNGALSLILPERTSEHAGHSFMHAKSEWVERNLNKLSLTQQNLKPESLNLRLLNEIWNIEYINQDTVNVQLKEVQPYKLIVSADLDTNDNNVDKFAEFHRAINQWCKKKSRTVFKDMLEQLAEQHGFHYRGLSIRAQKTRWGSCSSKKNINLNCKLLFMPLEVVQYVMIHELCHTIEMNHSARFWNLVADCDPNYQSHRKQLKSLGKELFL